MHSLARLLARFLQDVEFFDHWDLVPSFTAPIFRHPVHQPLSAWEPGVTHFAVFRAPQKLILLAIHKASVQAVSSFSPLLMIPVRVRIVIL